VGYDDTIILKALKSQNLIKALFHVNRVSALEKVKLSRRIVEGERIKTIAN